MLAFGDRNHFVPGGKYSEYDYTFTGADKKFRYIEKSTCNVYDALASDFDDPV
jgi:hypothetical protein